jgi:undecaprenyl-diphosphatase
LTVLFIGFAQAFALLPGISRSGLTISTAMILGIQHDKAAKFAIFMAIPVLLGAGLLQVVRIETMSSIALFPLILGFFTSAITGYLVISWLLAVISQGKFYLFSLYCFMIALLAFTVIN